MSEYSESHSVNHIRSLKNMAKHRKRITDIKILRPLYEECKAGKITLDKFAKSIHLGERQARRNIAKFKKTNEIPITRGFGSKPPYSEEDCYKVFEMAYNGTSAKELILNFNFKDRKAYRHYNILSHLSKEFDCVVSKDNRTCIFTTFIICNCIKESVIAVVITLDLIEKKISAISVTKTKKRDLPINGSGKAEYDCFVKFIIQQMIKSYFKKIKMREMLDRLEENQRVEKLQNYISYVFEGIDNSELYTFIFNIIKILFPHINSN